MTSRSAEIDEVVALDRAIDGLMTAYWRQFRTVMRAAGISPPQFFALRLIAGQDGMRMSRIAECLGHSFGATTSLIDRLVEHGWASREAISGDRRCVGVRVEPSGQAKIAEVAGAMGRHFEQTAAALTPEVLKALEILCLAAERAGWSLE